MTDLLLGSNYEFDRLKGIWSRPGYVGISYSDGDEVEARISRVVDQAKDVSVLSSELASHCSDWPTLYHLSRTRANLLRPFESLLRGKTVLEVGAGCGAITRYLGEVGAEVLALEGSVRRGSIAASRCRGLENVEVIVETFDKFDAARQFDVLTLIGVLEYARKFFPGNGDDPVNSMLVAAKRFIKPGGILIIAIENQLGLKYFAGFPEDHTGTPMFGIEEHYREGTVATFGRRELSRRVAKAGLESQQWWYPFPDYKLPSLIVSEAGASPQEDIDLGPIIRSTCTRDPQYPLSLSFFPERAWHPLLRNQLLSDISNSFLLLASDTNLFHDENLPFAIHYATDRRPEFAKKVEFKRKKNGALSTHPIALYPSSIPQKDLKIRQQLLDQPFIKGELWHDRLIRILTTPDWTVKQLQEWTQTWLNAFCMIAGISNSEGLEEKKVEGKYFDAVPRNMFLDESHRPVFIDQEWQFREERTVGYLCFRALFTSFSSIRAVARPYDDKYLNIRELFICIMKSINIGLDEFKIKEYLDSERELDHLVSGREAQAAEDAASWFASLRMRVLDTQTPVHERLAQREEQLAIASQRLVEREQELVNIHNSTSWRITRPLRVLGRWLRQT